MENLTIFPTHFILRLVVHCQVMIGELLQELRKDKGLTQRQLAKELSIAASSIGGYEAENITPSFDVLIQIAIFFIA